MAATSEPQGRRASDKVPPAIALAITEGDARTRHEMRGEFTAAMLSLTNKLTELSTAIVAGQLKQTQEHAEVNGRLDALNRSIAALETVPARVDRLERHIDIDDAREEERAEMLKAMRDSRRWVIATCLTVIALFLTLLGIVATSV